MTICCHAGSIQAPVSLHDQPQMQLMGNQDLLDPDTFLVKVESACLGATLRMRMLGMLSTLSILQRAQYTYACQAPAWAQGPVPSI